MMGNSASSSSKMSESIVKDSEMSEVNKTTINDLPPEVLANIIQYLPVKDQREFAQTSKKNRAVLQDFPQLLIPGLAQSDDARVKRALTKNPNINKIEQDKVTTVPLLILAKEHRKLLKPKNLDLTIIERQETLQVNTRKLFPLIKGRFERFERAVTAMIKLPGNRMASIRHHHTIKILDLQTGALMHTLEEGLGLMPRYTLQLLPAAPDGKVLLASNSTRSIFIDILDPDTGKHVRGLRLSHIADRFQVLPPEPNGKVLLTTAGLGGIKIWDLHTDALIRESQGHNDWLWAFRVLPPGPDGKVLLASGLHNGTIKIWDPSTCALIHTLRGHTDIVRALEGFPSGPNGEVLLASGSNDKAIKIWNPLTGALIDTLQGHTSLVMALQALPPGPSGEVLLASGSLDNTLKIWNVGTGECLQTVVAESPVWSLMYDAGVLRAGLENGSIVSIHFKGVDLDALLGPETSSNKSTLGF